MTWDVVVAGGGLSGLYTAWRLAQAGRSVALFEAGARLGGRLYSALPEGMPHVPAELGGMRFPVHHRFIWALAEHLGLERAPFPDADDLHLFYLRGQRLRREDFQHPERVPYRLEAHEQGKTPEDLLLEVLTRAFPGFADYEWDDWEQRRHTFTSEQQHMSDIGFWNMLAPHCSTEAMSLIRDAGGYNTAFLNWNATENTYFIIEHVAGDGKANAVRGGCNRLPLEIADRFEQLGGTLVKGRALRRYSACMEGVALHFEDGHTAVAKELVLAMPRRSLELIEGPLFDHRDFVDMLQSVTGVRACKLFLGFERPWWRDLGIHHGHSVTDLPLRQCYYFATEGEQPGGEVGNHRSLLMAGYNDGPSVDFWSGYLPRTLRDHRLGRNPIAEEHLPAPSAMVTELHRQLEQLHGCTIPTPCTALFQDWEQDPYGGGWHTWRVHARSGEITARMRHPVAELPIYVCGEAYSNLHGWAQGALNSAEIMCQQQLRLPPASFLPADHRLE